MAEVKLHGAWPSPFTYRVMWTLKLKGIPYEYVEEDLFNKSVSLLQYNPVHKKTPVLLHHGNPICESMVILEYLDENWPQYQLLPADPYERATARFWVKFIEDKGVAMYMILYHTSAELQEQAVKEAVEMLKTIEEHAMGSVGKYFGGDKIGIVDIAFSGIAAWLDVIEEVVSIKAFESHKFPKLNEWINNFKEAPIIKDNLPDRDQMVAFFKGRREMVLASA